MLPYILMILQQKLAMLLSVRDPVLPTGTSLSILTILFSRTLPRTSRRVRSLVQSDRLLKI